MRYHTMLEILSSVERVVYASDCLGDCCSRMRRVKRVVMCKVLSAGSWLRVDTCYNQALIPVTTFDSLFDPTI